MGSEYSTLTGWLRCIPGFHLGMPLTMRSASASIFSLTVFA
ncbi:hypothetical protein EVA_09192 [gut metagenome]|uniref:Uncharacterized protein n=1 Tax=gut metagenome TaxID=749906 RepID=J9GRH4_9ZZZZ